MTIQEKDNKKGSAQPLRKISLIQKSDVWVGVFPAMASDCEVQFHHVDRSLAERLTLLAANETWRIQDKFSRYQKDSILSKINLAAGDFVSVDAETAALINYAFKCFELSDGLFDITSGLLRKVWRFDGSDNIPSQKNISALLPFIGMEKVEWQNNKIKLRKGMELDLGGIGKEYAVDKVLQMLNAQSNTPILVNFGGDIAANMAPYARKSWSIGISQLVDKEKAERVVNVASGGIATSGDTQRFLLRNGVRYSHVLNPKTGWPTSNSPHTITVMAPTCTDAGILATLAMLNEVKAEEFLAAQQVEYFCQW